MKPFKSSCHKSLAETVVFNENLFWIKASLFVAFSGRCFSSRTMTLPPVHKWWNTKFDVWSCLCTEDEIKYNVFQVEQYSVDKSSWSWPMKQLSVLSHTQSLLLFNPILQQPWFLLCSVLRIPWHEQSNMTAEDRHLQTVLLNVAFCHNYRLNIYCDSCCIAFVLLFWAFWVQRVRNQLFVLFPTSQWVFSVADSRGFLCNSKLMSDYCGKFLHHKWLWPESISFLGAQIVSSYLWLCAQV